MLPSSLPSSLLKMSHEEPLAPKVNVQQSIVHQYSPLDTPQRQASSFANTQGLFSNEKTDNLKLAYLKRKIFRYGFIRLWWSELLSCFLFIGALVAIIITVLPYTNEPLPQWRYNLSINTLIAIYVVILKATILFVVAEGISQLKWTWYYQQRPLKDLLIFDNASRGPWGALILIWRLRGRYIVSCGAFIMVAALIIDPFAQQIISTYDCRIPIASEVASVPRTNLFDHREQPWSYAPVHLGMQKAINSGLYNPGGSVSFNCPTSNCTFPSEYHTVAYCSECNDTTSILSLEDTSHLLEDVDGTHYTVSQNFTDSQKHDNMSMTFSDGTNVQAFEIQTNTQGYTKIIAPQLSINQSRSCPDDFSSLEEQLDEDGRTKNNHVKWGCFALRGGYRSSGIDLGIGAASCTLRPCVRTYTASVNNGLIDETLLSVAKLWSDEFSSTYMSGMVNIKCLNTHDRKSLVDEGYKIEGNLWVPYNSSKPRNYTVSDECIYEYSHATAKAIDAFFTTFLNGTIAKFGGDFSGPSPLQTLYNEGDLTFNRVEEMWKNMSDSMSVYLRQSSMKNVSAPAIGTSFRNETCVHIQWVFLIYPAILVLLSLIFFFSMVLKTRGTTTSRNDWKSSPLVLLFHGLHQEVIANREVSESVGAKEMEMIAEKIFVRLSNTDNGWSFTKG